MTKTTKLMWMSALGAIVIAPAAVTLAKRWPDHHRRLRRLQTDRQLTQAFSPAQRAQLSWSGKL